MAGPPPSSSFIGVDFVEQDDQLQQVDAKARNEQFRKDAEGEDFRAQRSAIVASELAAEVKPANSPRVQVAPKPRAKVPSFLQPKKRPSEGNSPAADSAAAPAAADAGKRQKAAEPEPEPEPEPAAALLGLGDYGSSDSGDDGDAKT